MQQTLDRLHEDLTGVRNPIWGQQRRDGHTATLTRLYHDVQDLLQIGGLPEEEPFPVGGLTLYKVTPAGKAHLHPRLTTCTTALKAEQGHKLHPTHVPGAELYEVELCAVCDTNIGPLVQVLLKGRKSLQSAAEAATGVAKVLGFGWELKQGLGQLPLQVPEELHLTASGYRTLYVGLRALREQSDWGYTPQSKIEQIRKFAAGTETKLQSSHTGAVAQITVSKRLYAIEHYLAEYLTAGQSVELTYQVLAGSSLQELRSNPDSGLRSISESLWGEIVNYDKEADADTPLLLWFSKHYALPGHPTDARDVAVGLGGDLCVTSAEPHTEPVWQGGEDAGIRPTFIDAVPERLKDLAKLREVVTVAETIKDAQQMTWRQAIRAARATLQEF